MTPCCSKVAFLFESSYNNFVIFFIKLQSSIAHNSRTVKATSLILDVLESICSLLYSIFYTKNQVAKQKTKLSRSKNHRVLVVLGIRVNPIIISIHIPLLGMENSLKGVVLFRIMQFSLRIVPYLIEECVY